MSEPTTKAGKALLDDIYLVPQVTDIAERILTIEAEARAQVECPEVEVTDDEAAKDTTIAALREALEWFLDGPLDRAQENAAAILSDTSQAADKAKADIEAPWRAFVAEFASWADDGEDDDGLLAKARSQLQAGQKEPDHE